MLNNDFDEIISKIEKLKCHDIVVRKDEELNFHLFLDEEWEEGQIGYRIDTNGNTLFGKKEGDWKESWYVIGYEEDLGDPIFVDIDNKNYPIFTAEHGLGQWIPFVLFNSLEEFITEII